MTTITQSTDLKAAILDVLKEHHGDGNCITAVDIGEEVGLGTLRNTWVVREKITELIEDGHPICSNGYGYFIGETWWEINTCYQDLRERGIKVLERAANIQKAATLEFNKAKKVRMF